MGAYPNALYLLTGVASVLFACIFLAVWLLYWLEGVVDKRRRRRPADPPPAPPPTMQVHRPRRYSTPTLPYRPVSSRKETRR